MRQLFTSRRSRASLLRATTATLSLLCSFNCLAYDFSAYTPTLDLGGFSIDSAYNLQFSRVSENEAFDFVAYDADTDNHLTPVYYKIDFQYDGGSTGATEHSHFLSPRIDSIIGYFHNVGMTSDSFSIVGGAINSNTGSSINTIIADFINCSVFNSGHGTTFAGAIFNGVNYGGLHHEGKIGDITGDFIGNSATNTSTGQTVGGAIANIIGVIKSVKGNFIGNYAHGTNGYTLAGAIGNNSGTIGSIDGVFIANYAKSDNSLAQGGAVYSTRGNVSDHPLEGIPNNPFINGTFIANYAEGGTSASGGAIASSTASVMPDMRGDFIGNYAKGNIGATGGAIYAATKFVTLSGNFIGNHSESVTGRAMGGALYVRSSGVAADADNYNVVNSSFIGNYAKGATEAFGGAIASMNDLNIVAKDGNSVFANNYVDIAGAKTANDIYMKGSEGAILNLNIIANNGSVSFGSGIDGEYYNLNLSSDSQGTIIVDAPIKNANIINTEVGTNVVLSQYLNDNNNLIINSGEVNVLSMNNNLHLKKLTLNRGELNIVNTKVNLALQQMPILMADDYSNLGGEINVKQVTVTTDGAEESTLVNFTDNLIADKVVSAVNEAMGPVYRYEVNYDAATGDFEFTRRSDPTPDDVNPEVEVPMVATAATVAALNDEIYSRVLNDVDALKDSTANVSSSDRSIKNAWVKSFGSKDAVDLKDFVGADTKFAGLIGGLSSNRINEGNGWSAIYSIYGAYAGGEQKFAGEKVTNHGVYLGLGANFYNGDFFVGTTVNGGIMRNRSDKTGFDGKDKFNSYMGGVAVKTGYDYHLGSFTVEPNVYASYTIISAEDYVTKSGAKVKFGDMGVIEAAPGLKLSQDFGEGFKGYLSGRYVWSFTQGQHVTANDFTLPDVELEDYAEYGIGLEKSWGDRAAGFVEVKRRDGGREGWNFNLGYKTSF